MGVCHPILIYIIHPGICKKRYFFPSKHCISKLNDEGYATSPHTELHIKIKNYFPY